jgi:[amino-group carrier protein]-gamma-(L-lysyl/L-ornithyl)-L-glutamate aminotransferase
MNSQQTKTIHQHFLLNTYPFRGLNLVKGKGAYLVDSQGNEYLDLMTNYGVNIFGYSNQKLKQSLIDQIQTLPTLHCSFANPVRAQAAKALVQRAGGRIKKVYFANSGTEAVEAAIKFALKASGKNKIVAMKNSYHGKTLASLSVTYAQKYRKGLSCLLDVSFADFGNLNSLKNNLKDDVAALILEPIQGESGIIIPTKGYLEKVANPCQLRGIILILDEIQSGVGRTGHFLASQADNIEADIVCLGKGLAGGIPIGITLVSEAIAKAIPKAFHTSTFGGNPLACQGILQILELLNEDCLASIKANGQYFIQRLRQIKSKNIVEVRGKGLMIGVEVNVDRNSILQALQKEKILACPAGDRVVRFLASYIINRQQIDLAVETFERILKNV